MCGCSVPAGRFPQSDGSVDLQVVTFKGLGRGLGFEVVSRRSARDDEGMRAAVLERAQTILSSLDPTWVKGRQETDIEFLRTDLSETERRLTDRGRDLAAAKRLLQSKDEEVKELKERLAGAEAKLRTQQIQHQQSLRELAAQQQYAGEQAATLTKWRTHASALQKSVQDREAELSEWKQRTESLEDEIGRASLRYRALASKVRNLLEALGPLFQKGEFISMDDEAFQGDYEEARRARAEVRRHLAESAGEEDD